MSWLSQAAKNVYSQFGEDGLIQAIFAKIGAANKWCVECGAADGLFFSNTRKLIEEGWSSVQIEADDAKYEKLHGLYFKNSRVKTYNLQVGCGPKDVGFALAFTRLAPDMPKDFDLLVIDVDSIDYHLWNQLLEYRPRVVICEFDPSADPDFIPEIGGPGQAGERAIQHVALARGYQPVCKTQVNLICVRNDLVPMLADEPAEVKQETNGHHRELKIGAAMSTPRFGPLSTFDCILQALQPFNIPLFRGEGAFWSHALSRSIEKVLQYGGEYVLTIDYDTIFCAQPNNSDIAKLAVLMHDNPDVDVIVPFQMRREGGPLLANTGGTEVRISDRLIPIDQGHFGLTMFRRSVFERIDKPWFRESAGPDGHWNEGRIDADIGFWLNCKEHGIKVALATDVIIGHGEYVVTWPDEAMKPYYQPLNAWRETGAKPAEAFDREKFVQAAIEGRAKIEVKLDMGE